MAGPICSLDRGTFSRPHRGLLRPKALPAILASTLLLGLSACSDASDSGSTDNQLPRILTAESSENYLPDFSYAGYNFGVGTPESRPGKTIDVIDFGVVANDGKDDSHALLAAIEAANKVDGPVTIHLPAGRIILSEVLFLERSHLTLKGAGSGEGGTTVLMPRPLRFIDTGSHLDEIREYLLVNDKRQREKDKNLDILFSEYSWTAGFIWTKKPESRPSAYLDKFAKKPAALASLTRGKRGGFTVATSNPDQFKAGQVIRIDWRNALGKDGPLIGQIYGETDLEIGSRLWSSADRVLVKQTTRVVGVEGNTITIASPLMHDIGDELPATAVDPQYLEEVGIEGIHFEFPMSPHFGHHVEQGYNAIYLTDVFNSWVRNVRITNADSGILNYNSSNVTISDVTTDGDHVAHYSVHVGNVHNMLVERLSVENPAIHSFSFNTQSTRSVYKDSIVYRAAVIDQHAGANHQNLYDNITMHIEPVVKGGKLAYPVFDGSGAGYWQPGHGAFNTTWNLQLVVEGAESDAPVVVQGLAEGPHARIVGISGNRTFELDYRPKPYTEFLNQPVTAAPSLYDYQLARRLAKDSNSAD